MPETSEMTANATLHGEKLYQLRARQALPILVRQAKAEQPIQYANLAEELGMPNPRNLNYVLGLIGNALKRLSGEWSREVPPLQAIVVNKVTGLPGEGFAPFAPDLQAYRHGSTAQRRAIVNAMLSSVYAYEHWDQVLDYFGLQPLSSHSTHAIQMWLNELHTSPGESADHRALKEFIARHPYAVGLASSCAHGDLEYEFISADVIDILFHCGNQWVGVEVKSARSPISDIARGLFQCVKYQALLEATQKVQQLPINCRVLLAIESEFPKELIPLRNTLGVQVYDHVMRP